MMKTFLPVFCLLFAASLGNCWKQPWFCHEYECPEYSVISSNKENDFEERFYKPTRWITTTVPSLNKKDVTDGFWKLYHFTQGRNDKKKEVPTTKPGLVSVIEADGEERVSVSFYVPPNTHLPKPDDQSITEETRPGGTIYVREFPGVATESDARKNKEKLMDYLQSEGKLFDGSRFEGAGYDSINLINRHNEIWLYAI